MSTLTNPTSRPHAMTTFAPPHKKVLCGLALAGALGLAALAAPASAATLVPDTATALGDVAGSAPYTAGAVLTTAYVDTTDPLLSEPGAVGTGAVDFVALEAALGWPLDADTYEGSALVWQFNGVAGSTLHLDWALATQDFDPAFLDRAQLWLNGVLLHSVAVAAADQAGTWQAVLGQDGLNTLAVAVLDVNDVSGTSTLRLGNLSLGSANTVPEPGSLALGALALAGLWATRRKVAQLPV